MKQTIAHWLLILYNIRGQDSRFSLRSRSLVVLFTIVCYTECEIRSQQRGFASLEALVEVLKQEMDERR
jgi:hypothetical protein